MEKIKEIEIALLNDEKQINDNISDFLKIMSGKIKITKDFKNEEEFLKFYEEFVLTVYKELLSKIKEDFTHIGIFLTYENGNRKDESYSLEILDAMEKFSEEKIFGIVEAAKMVYNK